MPVFPNDDIHDDPLTHHVLSPMDMLLLHLSSSTVHMFREFKTRYARSVDNRRMALDLERWFEDYFVSASYDPGIAGAYWEALDEHQQDEVNRLIFMYRDLVFKVMLADPDSLEA